MSNPTIMIIQDGAMVSEDIANKFRTLLGKKPDCHERAFKKFFLKMEIQSLQALTIIHSMGYRLAPQKSVTEGISEKILSSKNS